MNVVRENQSSIPSYEKPVMEVMSLEIEGGILIGSGSDYHISIGGGDGGSSSGGTGFGGNGGFNWGDMD